MTFTANFCSRTSIRFPGRETLEAVACVVRRVKIAIRAEGIPQPEVGAHCLDLRRISLHESCEIHQAIASAAQFAPVAIHQYLVYYQYNTILFNYEWVYCAYVLFPFKEHSRLKIWDVIDGNLPLG